MTGSIDVDLYPKNDPGRIAEIAQSLGLGSAFEREYGYYADAVSPMLPTLPEGWEQRLIKVAFDTGVTHGFSNPTMPPFQNMHAANRVTVNGYAQAYKQTSCHCRLSSIACAKPSWKLKNESVPFKR